MPESKSLAKMLREVGRIAALGGIGVLIAGLFLQTSTAYAGVFVMVLGGLAYVIGRLLSGPSN